MVPGDPVGVNVCVLLVPPSWYDPAPLGNRGSLSKILLKFMVGIEPSTPNTATVAPLASDGILMDVVPEAVALSETLMPVVVSVPEKETADM